jgi:hypothetical protein
MGDAVFGLGVILHPSTPRVSINVDDLIALLVAAKPTATQWVAEMQETPFRKSTVNGDGALGLFPTAQVTPFRVSISVF